MALSLSPADKQSENRPPGSTESMASSSQNRPPGSPKSAFHSALSHFQNRSRLQLTASSFQKRPPGSPKSVFRSAASRFRNRPPARPMASRFQNRNQRVRAGTSVNPARKMLPGNKRREAEGSELAVDALVNELRNFDLKEGPRVCLDSMEPPVTDRFQEVINDLKTLIYPDEPPSTSTQAVHTETKDSDSIETPLVVRVQEIINDLETFLNLDEPSSASIQAMHTETKDTMESPLSLRSQELVYGLETFLNLDEPSSTSTQAVPTEPRVNDKEKSAPVHVEAPKEVEDQKKKRNLNVVFIGHVGTGKSTIGGQILFLSGQVDDYTIQKYEKEAKNESRESWYMAYIMDTNEEERAKGKTVEVGRAHFETDTTRFAILEAQGHKTYVSNMVCGASQADIGVLVTSARKGEFETKYVKGGHSHEQVRLAKTLGVSKLIVVVNKMDHPTVNWSKTRYKKIVSDMTDILRNWYNMKEDVQFLPLSGLIGANMNKRMDKNICPWWDGPCLFEALDAVEVPPRDPSGPFRMPIIEKFQDMGIVVMGKLECGSVTEGDIILVMPNKTEVKVLAIYCDESKVRHDEPGEYVCVKLSSIADEYISSGFVLSSMARPIHAVTEFDADLQILELLDNGTFAVGYKAVLYIHSVIVGSEIVGLSKLDRRRHQRLERDFLFVKSWARVAVRIRVNDLICVENFLDFPQLGNFILRTEEGEPVAVGQVTGFPASDSDAMKPDPEKFLHWLNEGSMEDLMKLKGVGKTYAQYIVKFREENPRPCPFERVEDLNKTRIRPNMVNRILKLNCKY